MSEALELSSFLEKTSTHESEHSEELKQLALKGSEELKQLALKDWVSFLQQFSQP